jgi:hypothetical protein
MKYKMCQSAFKFCKPNDNQADNARRTESGTFGRKGTPSL